MNGIFGIDEDMIMNTITDALEEAAYNVSEKQFIKIVDTIEEVMPDVVETILYGMMVHWRKEARDSGTGWGEKYASAIDAKMTADGKGEVFVDETLIDKSSDKPIMMFVSMIEKGVKSWSIKDALLKSDKAKVGKDNVRYITIPFPVATPRAKNQGTMQSKFGKREMTAEMYRIVRGGGKIKSGKLKSGENIAGLQRVVTRQFHSQYMIFRRITKDSKGWQHPGRGQSPVFPSVLSEVNLRVHETLAAFCKNIVKEYTT